MTFELRATALFVVVSILSGILAEWVLSNIFGAQSGVSGWIRTYSGWIQAIASAVILFWLLRYLTKRQKRAEALLHASEERYRAISEIMSDYTFSYRVLPDGGMELEWLTPSFERLTGRQIDGMQNEVVFDHFHPDDRDAAAQAVEAALRGNPSGGDYRIVMPDGTVRWLHIERQVERDGERVVRFMGAARDITAQKEAEFALQQERDLMRTLIDQLPEAIYVKDVEGRFVLANAAMARFLGAESARDLIGKTALDFPRPARAALQTDEMRVVQTGEALLNYEELTEDAHGQQRWHHVDKIPIHDARGQVKGLIGIARDITERRRMQAEQMENERLRLALDKESQLRRLRNRFMTMVSHEFRTPLATMLLAADMLERYFDRMSPESRAEHTAKIRAEARYLGQMLDDILALIKAEGEEQEFNRMLVDLVALSRTVVDSYRLSEGSTHAFRFTSHLKAAYVMGDEKLLRQAIINLLSNAMKYSSNGSTVDVEVAQSDSRLRLRIRDEGIGIPQENIGLVFDAFYRGDNVGNIPGTGLGLVITRRAVELHNGTIELESTLGSGSTVTVYLPLAVAPVPTSTTDIQDAHRTGTSGSP